MKYLSLILFSIFIMACEPPKEEDTLTNAGDNSPSSDSGSSSGGNSTPAPSGWGVIFVSSWTGNTTNGISDFDGVCRRFSINYRVCPSQYNFLV